MSDTSDFKRGQIVGARLAGASVTKAAGLCDVSRATVSRVMSAYNQEGRTTSNRSNCGRKRKLSERDVRLLTRIVSKRHKTTAAQFTAELNVHLSSPVSTKTVRRELHRVNIYGRAAVPKSLVSCETTEDCPVESPKDESPKSGGICKICPNSEPLLDDPAQPEAPSSH